jgi:hypothetical protein
VVVLAEWGVIIEVPSETPDEDATRLSSTVLDALREWTANATQRMSIEARRPVQVRVQAD